MTRALTVLACATIAIDAALLRFGAISPLVALALFVLVECPLSGLAAYRLVCEYRAHRIVSTPAEARRRLLAGQPLLRAGATEVRNVADLGRWALRRPAVPDGAEALGYSRGTLFLPAALAVACAIEAVAIHVVVPWPTARLVLDVLGLYGLVVVLGLTATRVVRPHWISDGVLHLRQGAHEVAQVPLETIRAVRPDRRLGPTTACIEDAEGCATGILAGPDGTHILLELVEPLPFSLPSVPWRTPAPRPVTRIRLRLDDPHAPALLA